MNPALALNLLALGALLAYIAWRAVPVTEAVRLRNALLLDPCTPGDFTWSPPAFPPSFRRETRVATPEFVAIAQAVAGRDDGSDWPRALRLAGHLAEHAAEKGPLQADLAATYRGIRDGHGYCADFVKVYLALAHAAGLTARQWAFSFDGFGGHGHTLVEVFDRRRGRWGLVDVHNNVHFVDPASGEPLDAAQMRDALHDLRSLPDLLPNGPGRMGFRYPDKAADYYRNGAEGWYLWWGNAVFSFYGHPAVAAASRVSRRLAHLVANLLGLQPRIRIVVTPVNERAVAAMFALRTRLRIVIAAILCLVVALVAQLAFLGRHGG